MAEARELNKIMNDPNTLSSRVFIGNIPQKMDKDELMDKFGMYGKIAGLIPKPGFAFVQYEDEQSASDAIANECGKAYYGRKLDVKAATQRKEPDRMDRGGPPNRMDRGGPPDRMDRGGPPDRMDRGGPPDRMDRGGPLDRMDRGGPPDRMDRGGPPDRMDRGGPPDRMDREIPPLMGRDRSPIRGGPRDWDEQDRFDEPPAFRGRGGGRGGRGGRGGGDRMDRFGRGDDRADDFGRGLADDFRGPPDDFRGPPGDLRGGPPDMDREFNGGPRGRGPPVDFPPVEPVRPVIIPDRSNDCEIIVVNKMVREYAEFIERRLIKIGLTVDLLFPNEEVPLGRVMANISGRGTLFAIIVNMVNEEHRSLTLNILYGQPQEHRNMPLEDSLNFIARSFDAYMRGERGTGPGPVAVGQPVPDRHPEAIQTLLNLLRENRQLTVLQYDKVVKYLQEKREVQIKLEVGDAQGLPSIAGPGPPPTTKQQAELQHRIMNILNQQPGGPQPQPVPQAVQSPWQPQPPQQAPGPAPLLNDPTVQKALDSLMTGDLLKKISPGNPGPVKPPQPLFGAYAGGRR